MKRSELPIKRIYVYFLRTRGAISCNCLDVLLVVPIYPSSIKNGADVWGTVIRLSLGQRGRSGPCEVQLRPQPSFDAGDTNGLVETTKYKA